MAHNGLQLLKDSFILKKKRLWRGREGGLEVGRVVGRKGRLGPCSLLSHGGHRRDISGLKELAFWTCPLPPPQLYPYTPSHLKYPPPDPLFFFSALPVWTQRLARQVGATATVCM